MDVQAIHYPGFPTDLQAAFAALLTQAKGISVVHERVFENRLEYATELRRWARTSRWTRAASARASWARGACGACHSCMPATSAPARRSCWRRWPHRGQTIIIHAYHLDRGYEDLVGTLSSLGARIRRLNSVEAAEELLGAPGAGRDERLAPVP